MPSDGIRRRSSASASRVSSATSHCSYHLGVAPFRNRLLTAALIFRVFSHILEALSRNGDGSLVSFDMPERHGQNDLKDYLVPEALRSARRLILGDTRRTLASELHRLQSVDMFNHDSWHVFPHMMWEFLVADKHLNPGGVLCSHDVLETPRRPNAFPLFAEARDYTYGVFRNFGVARKDSTPRH